MRSSRRPPAVRFALSLCAAAALAACGGGHDDEASAAADPALALDGLWSPSVPTDHGEGPGVASDWWSAPRVATAAVAGADAHRLGHFDDAFGWPLMPIHVLLLPDGRVMSFGTTATPDPNSTANRTPQYDIWTPDLGTQAGAHLLLPNQTSANIFCAGQIIVPGLDRVLIAGGDRVVGGVANYGINAVSFFDIRSNTMSPGTAVMDKARWYPTPVVLDNGDVLILGGRVDPVPTSAPTPERFSPATGWRTLPGATSEAAYGSLNWSYPKAWLAPNRKVFVLSKWGATFYLDPSGAGALAQTPVTLPSLDAYFPAVMYAPGKILSTHYGGKVRLIDLNGNTPLATVGPSLSQERYHANATVLADGRVAFTGGSAAFNLVDRVAYRVEIWDPATGSWSLGAAASKMRLYHSTALLLPDARVLTAGGGAPGPVNNLNAEIYTPSYLYKADGSGALAPRPLIQSAPATVRWNTGFTVDVDSPVSRVTLVRTGAVTHSIDFDQRFLDLGYTQQGGQVQVQSPGSSAVAPPGNYLLFVFNGQKVPSVAKIIKLIDNGAPAPSPAPAPAPAPAPVPAPPSPAPPAPVPAPPPAPVPSPSPAPTPSGTVMPGMGRTGYWSALSGVDVPTIDAATGRTSFKTQAVASPFAELSQSVGGGMVLWQPHHVYRLTLNASAPNVQGRLKLFDASGATRWTTPWIASGQSGTVTTGATVNARFHQLALQAPAASQGWIEWQVVDLGPVGAPVPAPPAPVPAPPAPVPAPPAPVPAPPAPVPAPPAPVPAPPAPVPAPPAPVPAPPAPVPAPPAPVPAPPAPVPAPPAPVPAPPAPVPAPAGTAMPGMGQTGYWSALTSIGTPTFSAADGLTRFTITAQAAPFAELGQSVGAGMVPWQARRIYALTVTASGPGIQGRLKLFDGTTTTRWTTAWIGSGETALVTTGATVNPKFHQLALMAPPTTTGWIRWSVVDRGPAP